jgi:hypothetical protein
MEDIMKAVSLWLHRLRQSARLIVAGVCLTLIGLPHADASDRNVGASIQHRTEQSVAFEPNRGQTAADVRYIGRARDYTVFLTGTEAVFAPRLSKRLGVHEVETVRMRLLDANATPIVVAADELAGKVNYVSGSHPDAQLTGIPTYASVRYYAVYPNVDLVYRDNAGQLEYDFVVHPDGDPSAISLAFVGAKSSEIDDTGALKLTTLTGEMRQVLPAIYQERDGARDRVEGRWVRTGAQTFSVSVDDYDRTRPLVIDPLIMYSSYLGGSSGDWGMDISLDAAGNIYVAGGTTSINFPGATPRTSTATAGFVTKFTASGQILYSTYLLDTDNRGATGISVDPVGNAYVTGGTGNWRATAANDVFVAKLDAFGRVARPGGYFITFGSNVVDYGNRIAVDGAGNVYVAGVTNGSGFPTTTGAFRRTWAGGTDGFVTKVNAAGTAFVYSTLLGGRDDDSANDIAIDINGNAFVTGSTESSDFPVTAAGYQRTHRACYNADYCSKTAFVTKVNPWGTGLAYSTYLGGSGIDQETVAGGIAVDTAGSAYVTGSTRADNFPTTVGVIQPTAGEPLCYYTLCTDAFVTKLNPAGSALMYSTYLYGNAQDDATSIAVDGAGNAYVTGSTVSDYFPIVNAFQPKSHSFKDAFVVKLNNTATRLLYSSYLGGRSTAGESGPSIGSAIAVDALGRAFVTGWTEATDFPVTAGAAQPRAGACFDTIYGCSDAFVTKIDASGAGATQATWVKMASAAARVGTSIAAQWSGLAGPTAWDWIGIYPLGHSDQPYEIWGGWYTTGTSAGTIQMPLPATLAPGWYELRLWSDNDFWGPVARSTPFQVTP